MDTLRNAILLETDPEKEAALHRKLDAIVTERRIKKELESKAANKRRLIGVGVVSGFVFLMAVIGGNSPKDGEKSTAARQASAQTELTSATTLSEAEKAENWQRILDMREGKIESTPATAEAGPIAAIAEPTVERTTSDSSVFTDFAALLEFLHGER